MSRKITGLLVLSAGLTLILYGRTAALPFFFDDLDHIPYINATGLVELWGSSGGFPYYRPLTNTLWRLFAIFSGALNPIELHILNIILHAINGWLVGLIALRFSSDKRGGQKWLAAGWAAAFFVAFPLSYQGVAWVGAAFHLLATTLVGLAVWAGLKGVDQPKNIWPLISFGAAILAPFAHENGVAAAALVPAAVYFYRPDQFRLSGRAAVRWAAPIFVWLVVWLNVPKTRTEAMPAVALETIWQNTVYFFQGLVFPTTIFTGRLVSEFGWPDFGVVAIFGLGAVLILVGIYRLAQPQSELRRLMAFGATWWIIASLPAILALDFAYVLSSPRLLILPSFGIACLWGAAAAAAWSAAGNRVTGRLLAAGVPLYAVLAAGWTVWVHIDQHAALGRIWWQAAAITETVNRPGLDTVPVFVNFPTSMTNRSPFFPVGHEGTVFMVDYIPPERIMEVMTGLPVRSIMRAYQDIRPQRDYIYDVLDNGQDWPAILENNLRIDVWLVEYGENALGLRQIGSTVTPTRPTFPVAFDSLGVNILTTAAEKKEGMVELFIVWQVGETPPPFEWTAFVHVLDANGQLIAQDDGPPWAGTFPFGQWAPGAQHIDIRTVSAPESGESVAIGLYHSLTGERAEITLPGGQTTDALIIPIEQAR